MQKNGVWKFTPALIGLGSLLVYILACTSFSPDDSKVLYVTADPKTGVTGVAIYDRKSGKSELLFQPYLQEVQSLETRAALLRPQWVEDGHSILTTWRSGANDSADKTLDIAILPFDRREPARMFKLSGLGDSADMYCYWPVPVAGKFLFLLGQSNSIVRLDTGTGEMRRETNQNEIIVLPSPDNDHVFYLREPENSNGPSEFGHLNPETFARTPLFHPEGEVAPFAMALSRNAKTFAYQLEHEDPTVIHLLETGKPARKLSLDSLAGKTQVCVRQFSPKGNILYASFQSTADGSTNADYGFLEIPLDGSPIRKTVLISNTPVGDKDSVLGFQIDLSHDGKTLAVESLWLNYFGKPLKAEDCALFLVDLSKPSHKVTKVPIPLPPRDRPPPAGI